MKLTLLIVSAVLVLTGCQTDTAPMSQGAPSLKQIEAQARATVPAGYQLADQPIPEEVERIAPADVPGWDILVKDNCYFLRYGDIVYPATYDTTTDHASRMAAQPYCIG